MKKKKKEKKVKPLMTQEERYKWSEDMKDKLVNIGCTPQWGPINEFFKVLDEYVATGDSVSGKIDFWEAPMGGRDICYILSNRKDRANVVHLLMKERDRVEQKRDPHRR